jgi:hypothetical protein
MVPLDDVAEAIRTRGPLSFKGYHIPWDVLMDHMGTVSFKSGRFLLEGDQYPSEEWLRANAIDSDVVESWMKKGVN